MIHPFTPVQSQLNAYFPPKSHPYSRLEHRLEELITPSASLLEVGCGRTAPTLSKFKGRADNLNGVDLVNFAYDDPELHLVNGSVTDLRSFVDNSIDLAYSRSVMEHIEDPLAAFHELYRVLKVGGYWVFLTPNRYDYASIIASLVPNSMHSIIVRITEGRDEIDTFPTYYRANSKRAITKLCQQTGFELEHFERLTQYPSYLCFSRVFFWIGSQYERLIRSSEAFSLLRGWIFCSTIKRG
jgi:ubiquinone/menaquinone biosynthesis C-methylase UbiE